MPLNTEIEKIPNLPMMRKKFCTDEVYQMVQIGILPEESGWELIDGEIIHQMTIGSKHAGTVKKLNRLLTNLLNNAVIVSVQDLVHIDEHNEPEPDIALLIPRDDFYAEAHPERQDVLLIIEVSDSTLEYDRETKKTLYAEAGIKEFWLINLKQETVERYSNAADGIYYQMRIFGRGEIVRSKNIEKLSLAVNEILGDRPVENNLEN